MSKTIDDIDLENSELIPENLLYEIFEVQYDDLFCKILKISEKSFTYFLQQQVIFNLLIIHKKVDPSMLTAFHELFTKRYKENVKTMKNNYEIIKNKEKEENNDLVYLDVTKCYIHCHKCFNIVHKCGSKLILYEDHVYCTKCNNVYNQNQIMLFCQECKKNYFTKLRKPIFNNNKKFEKLFLLKYKEYHCPSGKEEKIKCIKCSNYLYFRLNTNNPKNEDCISTIYCIKCKLKYNLKDVYFKCKICLSNFKCQARIFRDFPSKKKRLLFLIHTLLRNKNALPNLNLCNKKCSCDLTKINEYYHDDGGIFLEGIKNNKKTIVCNICFNIIEYNQTNWNCPSCGQYFKYRNNNKSKSKNKSRSKAKNYSKSKSKSKNINIKNDNNSNIELIKKPVNNDIKKNPFSNNNNISSIYRKKIDINEYIINSQQNNNKIKNKILNKLDTSGGYNNNFDIKANLDNLKKIFIKKNDEIENKPIHKHRLLMVKSKSKNDVFVNRNTNKYNNHIANNRQFLSNSNDEQSGKININVFKDSFNEKDKEQIEDKNNIKVEKEKKEDKKTIDTNAIFNNIKNNIFNMDELYPEMYPQNGVKKPVRVSGRNFYVNINNDGTFQNYAFEPIVPIQKNSHIFNKKDILVGDNNNINNYNHKAKEKIDKKEKYKSGEILGNNTNLNIVGSKKNIKEIDNYEHIPIEKKSKKMHINYAKKIFFFNGKLSEDGRSYDENINFGLNKFQTNDLFRKYMKYGNNDKIEIHNNNNNYINNSDYFYENENNFSNANYDNYYYNFQNYEQNPQQFNLYNFNSENYSIIKLLGKGTSGKIYLVHDIQTHQEFALKSMIIDNDSDLKQKEEKYNLIYKITYENPELKIINIYGLELRKIDKYNMFLNVLMEKGNCDWENEIEKRKKKKNYYTEQELLYILTNLVGTFAYLQQKGISHRDVKPQNILCFGNNEYKICDFGEANIKNKKVKKIGNNKNLDISNQTIRGTEMYMSPILFRAVKFKPDSLTKYNSYKSDVFSLGLCFLYASTLDTSILIKVREILNMEKIGIIISQYFAGRYSQEYINLLMYMLQVDENYRPDFIELNSWLLYGNY